MARIDSYVLNTIAESRRSIPTLSIQSMRALHGRRQPAALCRGRISSFVRHFFAPQLGQYSPVFAKNGLVSCDGCRVMHAQCGPLHLCTRKLAASCALHAGASIPSTPPYFCLCCFHQFEFHLSVNGVSLVLCTALKADSGCIDSCAG